MNIKDYIASGILEALVLGDLTASEEQEVRAMIDQYPELKVELSNIEQDFEHLAQATASKPTISFDDILGGIYKDNIPTASSGLDQPKLEEKTDDFDKKYYISRISRYRTMAMAASFAALVASALALNYYNSAQESKGALAALESERQEYAQNYDMVKQRLNGLESDLEVIDNPSSQRIILGGTESAPDALAYAYWDNSSDDLYLSIQNLKELADNQQYQLWAIIDGKPVDAGVFDWNADGLVKMKTFSQGVELFAVTIEPRGGSEGPSLETMQVAGAPGSKS
ncbi:MAG: anti-sigma factor [Eudoraea sp.]|nr:anti-sigma factor [Eudoraea sp.]